MGLFLLADILWGVGLLIMTPWQRPGPQFVRDMWLASAIAAMGALTVIGVLFLSDYVAAGLFFLSQLATAAYAARDQEFREVDHAAGRRGGARRDAKRMCLRLSYRSGSHAPR
jgi:hypothetical protein